MIPGGGVRKRAFFIRTVLKIALFCLVTVLALATLYANISMSGMHALLLDENMKGLEQLSGEFDGQLTQLMQLGVLLMQDFNTYEYLNARVYNANVASRSCLLLKNVRLLNSNLYSILLYNQNINDYLLAGESKIGIDQFTKQPVKRLRTKPGLDMVFSVITPQALYDSTSPMRTASLILYGVGGGEPFPGKAIIMNLDCRKINGDLLSVRGDMNIIADAGGEVAFSSQDQASLTSVADTEYFKSILKDGAAKGTLQTRMDHGSYIVSYIKSGLTGLYMISIKPLDALMTGMGKMQSLFVFIGLAALLISFLLSYFVSRNIYNPLRSIVDAALRTRFGHKAEGNEVKLISYVLTRSEAFIHDLEQQSQGQATLLREEYLRRLMHSSSGSAQINELSHQHSAQEMFPAYIAAVSIDHYQSMHEAAQGAVNALVQSLAAQCMPEALECHTVDMYDGTAALLLKIRAEENAGLQPLLQALRDMCSIFHHDTGITLTAGLGGRAESPMQCAPIYQHALDMVKHRFLLGSGMVIDDGLVASSLLTDLVYPQELEEDMVRAIHQNRKNDFTACVQRLKEIMKSHDYAQSVHVFFTSAMACLHAFIRITGPESGKFTASLTDLSNIFKDMETVDQAMEWLCSLYSEYELFISGIGCSKIQKYGGLIEKARHHIAGNYSDPCLSVESVAAAIGYAPYYFSRIFKETACVNINSYIRTVRIEKAKQLLKYTNIKINDIPSQVGFVSTSYFCAAFRKEAGLTPSEYRECHCREAGA